MNSSPSMQKKAAVLAIAVGLSGFGLMGFLGQTDGYTDALFEPDYTILQAPDDGPLAEAGFQPGDSVVTVEGIPVVDLGMYSRWPRSLARAPGESLTMTVEREGELVSGEVVFGEQPSSVRKMQFGFLVVLLCFLWAGVWAFLAIPSVHSARLLAIGLAAGFSIPGPSLGAWDGIADHINVGAEVLWLLLLLRFFLFFPKPKKIAQAHLSTLVIYAPWVAYLGCLVVELIYHPRFYHSFGGFLGLVMLFYMISAISALIHSWATTPKEEISTSGLGWALAGMGLGIGGVLLWAVDALLLTGFNIPGTNWAPILFAVVPVGMALGVKRAANDEEGRMAEA
jgi:hypothetical protein